MIDFNDAQRARPPAIRYDLDAIVAGLRARADAWVPHLFPNGRRVGDEWDRWNTCDPGGPMEGRALVCPIRPIESFPNLGPKSSLWLREFGIALITELERLGPVLA